MTDEPKSDRRQILERLKNDHAPESGPIAGGLDPSEAFVIASFHDKDVCARFVTALESAQIAATTSHKGRGIAVEVAVGNRTAVFEILERHQAKEPDKRSRGIRRDYDFRILGAVVGSVIGVMVAALSPQNPVLAIVIWTTLAFALGYTIDWLRKTA